MKIRLQNLRANHHGFGTVPELQFGPGECKEVESSLLDAFDNKVCARLFDEAQPGGAAFKLIQDNAEPVPVESLKQVMKQVSKPVDDGKLPTNPMPGPKTATELAALLNAAG